MTDRTEITYEISRSDAPDMRVTIPATWKVTYGAIVPGAKSMSGGAYGLRIWEGTDKQRGAISNVTEFIDTSIPIKIAAIRMYGQNQWYEDTGDYVEFADRFESGWADPDEVMEGPPPELRELIQQVTAPEHARKPW